MTAAKPTSTPRTKAVAVRNAKKELGDLVVKKLDLAVAALDEAKTAQATKKVADTVAALQTYVRRQKLSEEVKARGYAIWVDAMEQLGRYLREEEKAKGGRPLKTDTNSVLVSGPPTLAEKNISLKESALAQKIAALPAEDLAAVKSGEISLSAAVNCVKILRTSDTDTGGPTITLHRSDEPAAPSRFQTASQTARDFRNAPLERAIRQIEYLERDFARIEPIRDALANARRVIARHLEPAPAENGSGIHVVK